jgi:ribosomal protein S18 acetylase RimI-like enzyme
MSAMSASAHVSVLRRSPPPRALLASFSSPFARTRTDSNVTIRGASATDLPALANLCTDAFFGTHTFGDGPVIFAQRSAIYAKVFAQLARRIGIEDGREARLLVAVDPSTGALRGCVDLAVHLFDRLEQRFELTIDEMPENGRKRYSWLPYVASLAVSPESRRQGIARYALLRAAPRTPRAAVLS